MYESGIWHKVAYGETHLFSDFGFACELFLILRSTEGELGGVTFTWSRLDGVEGDEGEVGELPASLDVVEGDVGEVGGLATDLGSWQAGGGGVGLDWEGLEMYSVRSMGGDLTGDCG